MLRSARFGDPALASAEIYDPGTGTFSATGDMSTARDGHTAVLLSNGKVLIAGGYQRSAEVAGFLASAELYDPSSGTFSATGDMTSAWADRATPLTNGTVLITRGNPDGPPPYLSSADLYDPSTGTFAPAGYLNVNHTGPTANLLMNGEVLIAGGDIGDGDGASAFAELYDPVAGTFATTGALTIGREQGTSTLLADGTVLFAGGHVGLPASAEVYDPVQGTFAATGNMITRRELHTATLLKDGRVLIAGGDDERYWIPQTILASAELYCPVNANCSGDRWQQVIISMKASAGTDSLNFWQWAWYWQNAPAFSGAPTGFGVGGSISPALMAQITALGGGDPLADLSAEQWVSYFRQVTSQ